MKLSGHLLAGALALAALLPVGCKSDSSASGSGSGEAVDEGGDPLRLATDAALRDLNAKLSAQRATGWPAHLPMSSSDPARPVIRVSSFINKTSLLLDTHELEQRVARSLMEGGAVVVAASGAAREEAMNEREYADAMGDGGDAGGAEDAAGLVLMGELTDDVASVDGKRVHKYSVRMIVSDTIKGKPLVRAQAEVTGLEDE